MEWLITATVRLITAGKMIYARKWSFLGIFALVFVANILVLAKLDLLPEPVAAPVPVIEQPAAAAPAPPVVELPLKIEIEKIGLATSIANPTATDIETLDKELLSGAVRYPTSARLGEDGNIVLFGHSSYLPIVKNKAYKAFNDIQKLITGDLIKVYAADTVYTYAVRKVVKENAGVDAIALGVVGRVLTLSTCNSFGAKSDRFIVTADFVESHPVSI